MMNTGLLNTGKTLECFHLQGSLVFKRETISGYTVVFLSFLFIFLKPFEQGMLLQRINEQDAFGLWIIQKSV